jgi:Zn-dependent protease with chaperone function
MSIILVFSLLWPWNQAVTHAARSLAPAADEPQAIEIYLKKPYLELLELASTLQFSSRQFQEARERLKKGEKAKKEDLKSRQRDLEKQVREAQKELKELNKNDRAENAELQNERHLLHCRIQSLQAKLADIQVALETGIPVEYENYNAKLDLMEKWPAAEREIAQSIESGQYRTRRWSDVEDIGFRTIEENQGDDVKKGQEAIEELRRMGMLPKELDDKQITEYVQKVARRIAENSDLRVPLRVTILNSKEINAFALPGGFLFVNRGLLEEVQSESQLAGVVAHEVSHVVARHSHRLMKRANIASVIYQAAQIAAIILTGGVAGVGAYYALQYGFYGLGLALSLQLLGVSRDYEMEADILGVQYMWKAGYNTEGFIEFFDIMASKEGYVEKTSFFRTHPAFYDRIVGVFREISYLPKKDQTIESTSEFGVIRVHLKKIGENLDREEEDRPTLIHREEGCPEEGVS